MWQHCRRSGAAVPLHPALHLCREEGERNSGRGEREGEEEKGGGTERGKEGQREGDKKSEREEERQINEVVFETKCG